MTSFARELETTLQNALGAAATRRHAHATLEHLLLALIDDEHCSKVMAACGVDSNELRETVKHYLDTELEAFKQDGQTDPIPTTGFQRVVQRAILHVSAAEREEVTGANVLVALFSERESYAVYFLQQQDMSRLDAVSYISHGLGKGVDTPEPREIKGAEEKDKKNVDRYSADLLDRFTSFRSVNLDMKPHVDAVNLQPTLATPRIADKIVEFISELTLLYPAQKIAAGDCALTVGVYGPWGSGKSTLLSAIADIFKKDGAIVVQINAWKWDGEKNIHHFMTEQTLSSLSKLKIFRWKTKLIYMALFIRERSKLLIFFLSVITSATILYFSVDWSSASIVDMFKQGSLFAIIGAGVIGVLTKPAATLVEKFLISPKSEPEPGVKLSQAFKYLMVAKEIGDTAGKPIIFIIDDLDRCDPDRVMKFISSIQNLTLSGAINIIGCDDRIISASIYKQFKDIADLSGEGTSFGTKFLEKVVQVYFRMPNLSENDLVALGIKRPTAAPVMRTEVAPAQPSDNGTVTEAVYVANIAGHGPQKDLDDNAGTALDEIALSHICGEVLSAILIIYNLPIRRVKFLSNVMKLYTMIFPPLDVASALRVATFIGMINVDAEWLQAVYEKTDDEQPELLEKYDTIYKYLGDDKDIVRSLYHLFGVEYKPLKL
jgi:energy-coupling factor transporter ATP-binding protein EcfA2